MSHKRNKNKQKKNQLQKPQFPTICKSFTSDICTNVNCPMMHAYNYTQNLQKVEAIQTNSTIYQACQISQIQIALVTKDALQIYDIGQKIVLQQFITPGIISCLTYTPQYPDGANLLIYGGKDKQSSMLGLITTLNPQPISVASQHTSEIVFINFSHTSHILTGDIDGIITIWSYQNQSIFTQQVLTPDPILRSRIQGLDVLGNVLLASTNNGQVLGWQIDFQANTNIFLQSLQPEHQGKIVQSWTLNGQYYLTLGIDGKCYSWDSLNSWSCALVIDVKQFITGNINLFGIAQDSQNNYYLIGAMNKGMVAQFAISPSTQFLGVAKIINNTEIIKIIPAMIDNQAYFYLVNKSGEIKIFRFS